MFCMQLANDFVASNYIFTDENKEICQSAIDVILSIVNWDFKISPFMMIQDVNYYFFERINEYNK